jgi:prepilin-type N-terminal cleavage/methylation domain-containing protein
MQFPPMTTRPIPPVPAGRPHSAAFTLTELLVVIAIIVILAALSFPLFSSIRESGRTAENVARMKTVGTALLTGASEHRGYLPSAPHKRGRWMYAAHQYLGIRPDASLSTGQMPQLAVNGDAGRQIARDLFTAKFMRPAQLDHITKSMLAGSVEPGMRGVWLVNRQLLWSGTTYPQSGSAQWANAAPFPLHSIVAPSKTPLLAMSSTNSSHVMNGGAIDASAGAQGYQGATAQGAGPTPVKDGKMFYVMCDGSTQTLPDFWPFQDPEWPEPWKAFHPLGKNAPASDAP